MHQAVRKVVDKKVSHLHLKVKAIIHHLVKEICHHLVKEICHHLGVIKIKKIVQTTLMHQVAAW